MNRAWRRVAPLVLLVVLAGCGTAPSSSPPRNSQSPRVRCLTDPARDDASTSRPMVFFFCVESP
jgi:hypothetical protein